MKKELTRQQYLDLYYYMPLEPRRGRHHGEALPPEQIVGGLYSSEGQEAISVARRTRWKKRIGWRP